MSVKLFFRLVFDFIFGRRILDKAIHAESRDDTCGDNGDILDDFSHMILLNKALFYKIYNFSLKSNRFRKKI